MSIDNELLTENWVIPQDDYIINFDQWAPGNPLFITGASGDGKSTIARELANTYHAIVISSDILLLRIWKTKEKWDETLYQYKSGYTKSRAIDSIDLGDNIAMDYIGANPEIPYGLKDPVTKKTDSAAVRIEMHKFYKWFMDQTANNSKYSGQLYILEGCNICQLSPELMAAKPLIVVGGSRLRSFIRRIKRNKMKNDAGVIRSLFKYIKMYTTVQKPLDDDKDMFLKNLQSFKNTKLEENANAKTYTEGHIDVEHFCNPRVYLGTTLQINKKGNKTMGYKEYVEKCIMESGLEEADKLLEVLENAESRGDLEAIEEYLTEKEGSGSVRDQLAKIGKAAGNAYSGAKSAVGDKAAGNARNKMLKSDTSGYSSLEDFGLDVSDAEDAAFDKACANFDKGAIAVGATALVAALAGISLKVRSAIKKSNSASAKQIENQIKELEGQATDVAKRCKKGEITAKEAKVETKKIQSKIKKLVKEAAKVAKVEEAKPAKESVDVTDVQLDIFEAFESGNITEDERDDLLEMLES